MKVIIEHSMFPWETRHNDVLNMISSNSNEIIPCLQECFIVNREELVVELKKSIRSESPKIFQVEISERGGYYGAFRLDSGRIEGLISRREKEESRFEGPLIKIIKTKLRHREYRLQFLGNLREFTKQTPRWEISDFSEISVVQGMLYPVEVEGIPVTCNGFFNGFFSTKPTFYVELDKLRGYTQDSEQEQFKYLKFGKASH